jgi:hypothetical protein
VVRSATEPTHDQHSLGEPTYDEATPNLVDVHAWWTITASPEAVGCASVSLTIGARTGPPLSDYPGVTDELIRLGAVPVCAGRALSPSVSGPGRNGPVACAGAHRSVHMYR